MNRILASEASCLSRSRSGTRSEALPLAGALHAGVEADEVDSENRWLSPSGAINIAICCRYMAGNGVMEAPQACFSSFNAASSRSWWDRHRLRSAADESEAQAPESA